MACFCTHTLPGNFIQSHSLTYYMNTDISNFLSAAEFSYKLQIIYPFSNFTSPVLDISKLICPKLNSWSSLINLHLNWWHPTICTEKKKRGAPRWQPCPRCSKRACSPDCRSCHPGDRQRNGCHLCALWTKLLGHHSMTGGNKPGKMKERDSHNGIETMRR